MSLLKREGKWPSKTPFDAPLLLGNEGVVPPKDWYLKLLGEAEQKGQLVGFDLLPGPWQDARTLSERADLLRLQSRDAAQGYVHIRQAKWQLEYGGRGLSSNIMIPKVEGPERRIVPLVFLADPSDTARIAKTHVRKEPQLQEAIGNSVLATSDNAYWIKQREHLQLAFLPSSLRAILPRSRARAKGCANRLAALAAGGTAVDIYEFLLHEAMAQLQLALLGVSEDMAEETNVGIRAALGGDVERGQVGYLGEAMKSYMAHAHSDPNLAAPGEGRPIHGPLSRLVKSSALPEETNWGNMLIILFAGHDTTAKTLCWLLFELSRHPDIQAEVHREVDVFFEAIGSRDPEYEDLSRLGFVDRCITEALRLWPVAPGSTLRVFEFGDDIMGPDGKMVKVPQGTQFQTTRWSKHRNPDIWGPDVHHFNPQRNFTETELTHVGRHGAAVNPQSERFEPFNVAPRNCLGRNFSQMEMRLIVAYLLRHFRFELAPPYDSVMDKVCNAVPEIEEFRGTSAGTMGPMNLEKTTSYEWGVRYDNGMKLFARPRGSA